MALLYQKGYGLKKREAKAASLFTKASYLGNRPARAALAYCYLVGRGRNKNRLMTRFLYHKSFKKKYLSSNAENLQRRLYYEHSNGNFNIFEENNTNSS